MKTINIAVTAALVLGALSSIASQAQAHHEAQPKCAYYTYEFTKSVRQQLYQLGEHKEAEQIVRQIEACEVHKRGGMTPEQTQKLHASNDAEINQTRYEARQLQPDTRNASVQHRRY